MTLEKTLLYSFFFNPTSSSARLDQAEDDVFTPEIPSANAIFQIQQSHHLCPESF